MGNEVTKKDIDAVYKEISTQAGNCNKQMSTATEALRKQIDAAGSVQDKNLSALRDSVQKLDYRIAAVEEDVKWLVKAVEELQKK